MTSAKTIEEYQSDIESSFKKALDDKGESVNEVIHLLAQSLVDKQILDKDWLISLMAKVPDPADLDTAENIRWNKLVNSIEDYTRDRQVACGKSVASYGKWLSKDSKKRKSKKLKFPSFIDPKLKPSEARKLKWELTDKQIKEIRSALRSYELHGKLAKHTAKTSAKIPCAPAAILGIFGVLASISIDDKVRLLKVVLECAERDAKKRLVRSSTSRKYTRRVFVL